MAIYYRYQKLQKYKNGIPVEPPEYKEGEFIESGEWDSLKECENDYEKTLVKVGIVCVKDELVESKYYIYELFEVYYDSKPSGIYVRGEVPIDVKYGDDIEECKCDENWREVSGYICLEIEADETDNKIILKCYS